MTKVRAASQASPFYLSDVHEDPRLLIVAEVCLSGVEKITKITQRAALENEAKKSLVGRHYTVKRHDERMPENQTKPNQTNTLGCHDPTKCNRNS